MFDDFHFYNKGTRPAMLPKQLAKFQLMQDTLRAEYLQKLCNEHPDAFFRNIVISFNVTKRVDNPPGSHFSAKLSYTEEEHQPTHKAQLDAMYFELLEAAANSAFEETCKQIQTELGDDALYFYKNYEGCSEEEADEFLANAYGRNYLAITEAEIDEEDRLIAELNPAGPSL
jgi:hypothetical protein